MATVKELKAQAKAKGIKGFSTMKKAELEKALGGGETKPKVVIKKVGKFPLSKTSSEVMTIKKALEGGSGTLESKATKMAKGTLARAGIGIRGNRYIDLNKLSPEKQRDYLLSVRDGGKKAETPKKKVPAPAAEPAPKKKRRAAGVPMKETDKAEKVIMRRLRPRFIEHHTKQLGDDREAVESAARIVFNNLRKRKTPIDVGTADPKMLEKLVEKRLQRNFSPAPKSFFG